MGLKGLIGLILVLAAAFSAAADEIPLPRSRPAIPFEPQSFAEANQGLVDPKDLTSAPSECRLRLEEFATVEPLPRLIGPGECGGTDMVRITEVMTTDRTRIALRPAPVLRCPMAESLAAWVRDQVAPRFAATGTTLRSVETYDDFACRGRNRVFGAKLSEHGKGNAVDVRAFKFSDGRAITLTDPSVPKEVREHVREASCRMFTTVLGPGSDAHHESHIHLDLAARSRGYRICQWDMREPKASEVASNVPLPTPRPAMPERQEPASRKL